MPTPNKPGRTIESYLAGLPPDVAFIMERVRETIREIAPEMVESIKYGLPLYRYAGTYLYVGAWKKHIGLYPIYPAAAALEQQIAPHRVRKDTVRFPYTKPIPYDLVASIAKARTARAADHSD